MEQRIQEIRIDERVAVECPHCLDTHYVSLTCKEDGEEFEIIVRCRKCNREELHA